MNKEIIIPVCDLKAALPGLSKIVGRSRTLPVLQSVRVARDAEGKVSQSEPNGPMLPFASIQPAT